MLARPRLPGVPLAFSCGRASASHSGEIVLGKAVFAVTDEQGAKTVDGVGRSP